MRSLDVVVGEEAIEVALNLLDLLVPAGSAGDAEATPIETSSAS
jgi:hypothetical protein